MAGPRVVSDEREEAGQIERLLYEQELRQLALAGQEALVAEVSGILYEADPIGINVWHNSDEYDSEAESIVLRLHEADGPSALRRICHEVFVRWFDSPIAGPPERYDPISEAIWAATQRHSRSATSTRGDRSRPT
jgi:hypothetical protein